MPTCRATPKQGTWEFGDWSRRYAPAVESMSVVGGPVLHPIAAPNAAPGLDGVGTAGLVDGGNGSFFDPARVGGKVVLVKVSVERDLPGDGEPGPHGRRQGAARVRSGSRQVAARDRLRAAQPWPPTPFRWPRATSSRRSSLPPPVVS